MANVLLLYGNDIDAGTLTGGSWQPALPLSNLLLRGLHRYARSMSVDPDHTQFTASLPGPKLIKAICIGPSNLSVAHSYRITSTAIGLDTGWIIGQPQVDWNTLDWLDPNFWLGVTPWDDHERGLWIIHIFDEPVTMTGFRVEIDDRANSDGFVQFARLVAGRHWQPPYNYDYSGNGMSFRDNSFRSQSLGGSEVFWRRVNQRTFRMSFGLLPESELFGPVYDLQRIAGYDGEVFVIPDPADHENRQKRSFLATINTMDTLAQIAFGHGSTGFELKEII